MANPFYVEPLGGYGPQIAQGIQGLGQVIGQRREQEKAQAREAEMMAAAQEAMQSGDPVKMRDVAFKYPEVQERMSKAFGFTSGATKQAASNTYSRVLSDPANAERHMMQGIEEVQRLGGQPTNMMRDLEELRRDPQAALAQIELGVAGVAPDVHKALQARRASDIDVGKLGVERAKLAMRKEEGKLRAMEQALSRETNELKRQELQLKVEEKRQKIENTKREVDTKLSSAAANTTTAISNIDELLGNADYINSLTGWRGKAPVTTPGSSTDASVLFEQMLSQLTLDNLGLMSGVLTDKDIAVLRSAAAGIESGMSKEKFTEKLKFIRDKLAAKLEASGAQPVEAKAITDMSDDELMKAAFGGAR